MKLNQSQSRKNHNQVTLQNLDLPIAQRKEVRSCTQHPIYNFMSYKRLSPNYRAFATKLTEIQIPSSTQEAMQVSEWKQAILKNLGHFRRMVQREIVNQPSGKKLVGCKWIFTVKHNAYGSIDRLKAR